MEFIGIKTITELLKKFAAALKRCPGCGSPDVSDSINNKRGLCHVCLGKEKSVQQLQATPVNGNDW